MLCRSVLKNWSFTHTTTKATRRRRSNPMIHSTMWLNHCRSKSNYPASKALVFNGYVCWCKKMFAKIWSMLQTRSVFFSPSPSHFSKSPPREKQTYSFQLFTLCFFRFFSLTLILTWLFAEQQLSLLFWCPSLVSSSTFAHRFPFYLHTLENKLLKKTSKLPIHRSMFAHCHLTLSKPDECPCIFVLREEIHHTRLTRKTNIERTVRLEQGDRTWRSLRRRTKM